MYSGYIQIEHVDFRDDALIENTIPYDSVLVKTLQNTENVKSVVPRLSYFAFASTGALTKGVMFSGIDPVLEAEMTNLNKKIVQFSYTKNVINHLNEMNIPKYAQKSVWALEGRSFTNSDFLFDEIHLRDEDEIFYKIIADAAYVAGKYLKPNDKGVILGNRLAKFLKINVGDTLVLIGQGYHGAGAAGKFPVQGIIRLPNPTLDNSLVYSTLSNAQGFYNLYNGNQTFVSSYAINLHKTGDADVAKTVATIQSKISDSNILVRSWKEANKTLVQQIESDNESGKAMLAILYIVIAFGVFGTVLMMIAERKREMGVMIALGMKKFKLAIIISIEMLLIALTGLLAGIIGSVPLVLLGYYKPLRLSGEMAVMMEDMGFEPVMPMAWFGEYYLNQIWVVTIIIALVMIYPLMSISRLKVIEALKA